MSDAEVVAYLQRVPTTCGRFTEDQLDRPLLGPSLPPPRWRTWLAATTAALGLTLGSTAPARAQAAMALPGSMPQPAPPSARQPEPAPSAARRAADKADSLVYRGVVRNQWGRPLENAHVTLTTDEETERQFNGYTDEHGRYELTLPADVDVQNAVLTFYRRLYRSKSVTLDGDSRHHSAFLRKRKIRQVLMGSPRFR